MSSVQSTSLLYTWYFKALQTRRPVNCIETLSFSKPWLERGSYLSVHFSIGCNMAQVRCRRRREAKQTKSRKFQSERIASVLRDRVVMIPTTTQCWHLPWLIQNKHRNEAFKTFQPYQLCWHLPWLIQNKRRNDQLAQVPSFGSCPSPHRPAPADTQIRSYQVLVPLQGLPQPYSNGCGQSRST